MSAAEVQEAPTITQQLRADHLSFRCMLQEIESSLRERQLDCPERVKRTLKRLLPLLSAHEQVEERLLFPAALRAVAGLKPEVIEMFRAGHEELNEKLDVLRDALDIRMAPVSQFVAVVDFQSLLKDHMEEEEQALFPLIEKGMSGKDQLALGEGAQRLRTGAARGAKRSHSRPPREGPSGRTP